MRRWTARTPAWTRWRICMVSLAIFDQFWEISRHCRHPVAVILHQDDRADGERWADAQRRGSKEVARQSCRRRRSSETCTGERWDFLWSWWFELDYQAHRLSRFANCLIVWRRRELDTWERWVPLGEFSYDLNFEFRCSHRCSWRRRPRRWRRRLCWRRSTKSSIRSTIKCSRNEEVLLCVPR